VIADIGTDHALLPAYLLNEGRFERALLCDIVPGPLERARACVERCGLQQRCQLRLTAGFEGMDGTEFDTAAICGMGGLNIIEILTNAVPILKPSHRLLLQPQTDIFALRLFLLDSGYTLEQERAVCEQHRCYTVLSVRPPQQARAAAVPQEAELIGRCCEEPALYLGGLQPARFADDAAYVEMCLRLYRPMAQGAGLGKNRLLTRALNTLIENLERQLPKEEPR